MKIIFYLVLLLFISSCNKARTVFICGDHECVNKTEAKQYFEENLTIEVKILDSIEEKNFDLVELNLNKKKKKRKRKIKTHSKREAKRRRQHVRVSEKCRTDTREPRTRPSTFCNL